MINPTPRQKQVLDFIRVFVADKGHSPSYQEIAAEMGLASLATVHKHVNALRARGHIQFANMPRSITIQNPVEDELRAALNHALHRNHEVSHACSGCARGLELARTRVKCH